MWTVSLVLVSCGFDASGGGAGQSETLPQTTMSMQTSSSTHGEGTGQGTSVDDVTSGQDSTGKPSTTNDDDHDDTTSAETTQGACAILDSTACLSDEGLLVRYFLDEGAHDPSPDAALDSAVDPLALPIIATGSGPTYVEHDGHWGLEWTAVDHDGVASTAVMGTKLEQLEGATAGTIEVVVNVEAVSPNYSRFVHIGAGSEGGQFSLATNDVTNLSFRWHMETVLPWTVADMGARGRLVVHMVLNTQEAAGEDRLVLYINGEREPLPGTWAPPTGAINLSTNRDFALGNRANGGRSFAGALYYAAVYTVALPESVIERHAQILLVDDDAP
jgi:hypothetical protein